MRKALREAKIHSSWINPNRAYEEAVDRFIARRARPSPDNLFLRDFASFVEKSRPPALWNSLSQTLLKSPLRGCPISIRAAKSGISAWWIRITADLSIIRCEAGC